MVPCRLPVLCCCQTVCLHAIDAANTILGIQLYSVRDDMKKAPLDTLKQIATMGYKNVEHANYVDKKFYGYSATEFKKVLDGLGLNMPSGHTVMSGTIGIKQQMTLPMNGNKR